MAFAEHRGRKYCAVRVDKAIVTVKGGSETKAPKTEMSRRVAVMSYPFASLMEQLRAEGPIVATNGTRTQPATITRNFKLWCQRHEVEYIQPKNLRSYRCYGPRRRHDAWDALPGINRGEDDGDSGLRERLS